MNEVSLSVICVSKTNLTSSVIDSEVIIQGDLNIHYCHWLTSNKLDGEGKSLLDLSLSYGLYQLVEFQTYIGPHESSRLDLSSAGHSELFIVEI